MSVRNSGAAQWAVGRPAETKKIIKIFFLKKYADSCKVDASIILGLGRTKCCTLIQSVGVARLCQQATHLRSSGSYLVHLLSTNHYLLWCEVNHAGVLVKKY